MNKAITDLTGRAVKPLGTELPSDVLGAKQLSGMLNGGNRFMLSSGTGDCNKSCYSIKQNFGTYYTKNIWWCYLPKSCVSSYGSSFWSFQKYWCTFNRFYMENTSLKIAL